jgi:hypothetical protein
MKIRLLWALLVFGSSCGGASDTERINAMRSARHPPQPRGCAVQVFKDAPPAPTENIGSVMAFCSGGDSRDVCLRELEDQVCLMGGDVLWQIEGPTPEATASGMGQRMRGRAAHTK